MHTDQASASKSMLPLRQPCDATVEIPARLGGNTSYNAPMYPDAIIRRFMSPLIVREEGEHYLILAQVFFENRVITLTTVIDGQTYQKTMPCCVARLEVPVCDTAFTVHIHIAFNTSAPKRS